MYSFMLVVNEPLLLLYSTIFV